MEETGTCSLCDNPYEHYGNNPEPLAEFEERCCDDCNNRKVIPARLGRPNDTGLGELLARTQNMQERLDNPPT